MMPHYVQKVRVPVMLSQLNREAREGWFLVSAHGTADRPESLLELLNGSTVVIPFLPKHDPHVVLVTRHHVEWIAVAPDVAPHLVAPSDRRVTREQRVELRFIDNRHVEGIIQWDAAEDCLRLSDFLNGPDDFFVLKTPGGPLVVNRLRVAETRVAESSPRPAQTEAAVDFGAVPPFRAPAG